MKRYQKFVLFWLINSAILYLSTLIFPGTVTVGNFMFSPYQAIIFGGFIWSLIVWYTEAFLKDMEISVKENTAMMVSYFFANFAAVWLLARFAVITGIGIASFWYAAIIALAANFIQYAAWQYMDKKR